MLVNRNFAREFVLLSVAFLTKDVYGSMDDSFTSVGDASFEESSVNSTIDISFDKYTAELRDLNEKISVILAKLPNALELNVTSPEEYEKLSKFVEDNRLEFKPLIKSFMKLFLNGMKEASNTEKNFKRYKEFINNSNVPAINQVMYVWTSKELQNVDILAAEAARKAAEKSATTEAPTFDLFTNATLNDS